MSYSEEQFIYVVTNFSSAVVLIVISLFLLYMRHFRRFIRRAPVYPARYIMARRILGISYCVIGVLMLSQIATGITPKHDEFLPISGLCISTSQAMLFTGALLALYNSNLLRRSVILWNIFPIIWFLFMYGLFTSVPDVQRIVKIVFFAFYVLQLTGYTIVFFIERRKYLFHIEYYFDDSEYYIYRRNGIMVLFLCSLAVGMVALASYYFTELWHLTVFIACYTAYYVAVAIYFLNYELQCQKIADVTTPEEWHKTEDYKEEIS